MDLMTIIDSLFEDDAWYPFHDAVYEATNVSHPKEKLRELFLELPKDVQQTAFTWGLSDTVFRDEVYVFVTQNLAADKII